MDEVPEGVLGGCGGVRGGGLSPQGALEPRNGDILPPSFLSKMLECDELSPERTGG